ncbi:hypothetical protein CBR_g52688 [Chara braunii]|uniref:CCHC-type domain-containing protein n=1 Tax=Chara braunii TaxID=69332 RepID=A0A388MB12_CHABU|nr:hypothetical protein CBR_g52688 [Chara braunii]|eukprot:GBG91652.1 hypothetical protein CBR_g52688 [Chara braunii]
MTNEDRRGDQDGNRSGGGDRDRDRDRDRYRDHDRNRDQDRGREPSSDRDRERERGQRCGPPRCFRCQRVGHYANQCSWFDAPTASGDSQRARSSSPRRGYQGRSSSSGESRHTPELEKLERNVASLQEYVQLERAKKEEKEAKKKAKALAKQREEEERLERERSIAKRIEKKKRAEEKQLELAKSVDIQLDVGIEYRGKMHAIFDIADQKAGVAYGSEQEAGAEVQEAVGEGVNTGSDSGGEEEVTTVPNHE